MSPFPKKYPSSDSAIVNAHSVQIIIRYAIVFRRRCHRVAVWRTAFANVKHAHAQKKPKMTAESVRELCEGASLSYQGGMRNPAAGAIASSSDTTRHDSQRSLSRPSGS
jgi:hypothetical protein